MMRDATALADGSFAVLRPCRDTAASVAFTISTLTLAPSRAATSSANWTSGRRLSASIIANGPHGRQTPAKYPTPCGAPVELLVDRGPGSSARPAT